MKQHKHKIIGKFQVGDNIKIVVNKVLVPCRVTSYNGVTNKSIAIEIEGPRFGIEDMHLPEGAIC